MNDTSSDVKPAMVEGPKPIIKLDESVVNRIAAGEIIQRPSAALKELIENCLDAGAKSIKITVKDGGMKLLQIQDDGCGIRHADLPILAQRFTTSKLRDFEDLMAMTTYGFRGEALASISHVAHLSVLTKTKEATCAWKCKYSDGVLVPLSPGSSAEPSPAAGNQGTTITVEDLFYNVPTRKKALKSVSDEYSRIVDVVSRYAVHNPSVAFVCKKAGQAAPSISTPSLSNPQQTIKVTYGAIISKELIHLPLFEDEELGFKVEGWITGANYNANKKREGFLFFINHRLVDAPKIKKAVEALYSAILPKGAYPWIYLSLQIDPANIDVNVHPTKKEVRFLNEDEITESICEAMQEALTGSNSSRTFSMQSSQVQTLLPGASDPSRTRAVQAAEDEEEEEDESEEDQLPRRFEGRGNRSVQEVQIDMSSMSRPRSTSSSTNAKAGPSKPAPKHKIRVDPTVRTLDSMFPPINPFQPITHPSIPRTPSSSSSSAAFNNDNTNTARKRLKSAFTDDQGKAPEDAIDVDMLVEGLGSGEEDDDGIDWKDRGGGGDQEVEPTRKVGVGGGGLIKESVCALSSVRKLRENVRKEAHKEMSRMFQNHTYIGLVDYDLSLSVVQHETKMFMINHAAIAEELFYQLGLLQFGAYGRIRLQPPAEIKPLVDIAIKYEKEVPAVQKEVKANAIVQRLIDRRDMLEEYFMMEISEDGRLLTLPLLLPGYTPNFNRLPSFLMRLGPGVDWTDELGCFDSFLRELAFFYIPVPTFNNYNPKKRSSNEPESAERKHERFQVEHVIFPATRRHLFPPKSLNNGEVTQIANLPDLYKVFERC